MRPGWLAVIALFGLAFGSTAHAQDESIEGLMKCEALHDVVNRSEGDSRFRRTLCADVVALDQMLVYNRFGSFNPFGMMYALRRDVVSADIAPKALDADACDASLGIESYGTDLEPGKVRLRDCKRPRPLTLRSNPGDVLHIRLTNFLRDPVPGFSDDYCTAKAEDPAKPYGGLYHEIRGWLSEGSDSQVNHGEVSCKSDPGSPTAAGDTNWPRSRGANLAIQGLTAFGLRDGQVVEAPDACKGLSAIAPGKAIDCYYMIEREGPFFMASTGAPSGGQGDGGSLTHGLFGAVIAEPEDSTWYRSQVSRAAFAEAWRPKPGAVPHAINDADIGDMNRYELTVSDPVSGMEMPVLNMLRKEETDDTYSIVHSDLNAIVFRPGSEELEALNFREFSVFFHDELKTFYPRNFEELGDFAGGQLAGVRDGFAINYGASGMGDMLLANRKGIGPSANCQECLYEEFFLTSWANGDPALLEQFSEDPSNVHHSYLNDEIVFRNFHAGPKETHVFHLHAHQWFAGNDGGRGSYLDSQTVGPQQSFSYDIYKGGMEVYHKGAAGQQGWYETLGSGNRNRTVGDSIFHCHLYPHFAQGMWELWRVHDVLEDGSRKLPDGQWEPSLSFAELNAKTRAMKRPGSVDQATGRLIQPDGGLAGKNIGTPIPALVPLPGVAWPVLPTYPEDTAFLLEDGTVKAEEIEEIATFPGYPFYIAGQPGHRPPQAPMDIARALEGEKVTEEYLDGGLPRHVVTDNSTRALPFNVPQAVSDRLALDPAPSTMAEALVDSDLRDREALQSQVIAAALALGDLSMKFKKVQIDLLEYDGEPIERAAMAFHHDGELDSGTPLTVRNASGDVSGFVNEAGGYKTLGGIELFAVNGAPAKPGAPFADPCGAPAGLGQIARIDGTDYQFVVGGANHPVLTVPAGQPLAGGAAASDAEVSNWVDHTRTDVYPNGPPQLYYVDGGGTARLIERGAHVFEEDPFLKGLPQETFAADPAVVGYRRYEGSAVQVDLVTNRAGWHDPQARINVLSQNSDGYKDGGGRISPKVTASEEPFFFRALSGECIEFRHTNELPKELDLDDFQVKTPTDTIGQHIHLVKFDVTSSDGSGNGFNYEDGTFAPGEIAARICAAKNDPSTAALITANRDPGELLIREFDGLCKFDSEEERWKVSADFDHKIWRLKLSKFRDLFQTTTQRWFADPILSETRATDDVNGSSGAGLADRTLRTVFSHDHFGPSSIQQHGFYTALLIEPQTSQTCESNGTTCTPVRADREMIVADDLDIGARKVIVDLLPVDNHDPNTGEPVPSSVREFALSIADFAVLYDPRNSDHPDEVAKTIESAGDMAMKGMLTLACEAKYGRLGDASAMESQCGSALQNDSGTWSADGGDVPPAWLAAARPGDLPAHKQGMEPSLFAGLTVDYHGAMLPADAFLAKYLTEYRMRAAGFDPTDPNARLANPVAPPARPESISVDHHDPYLVNYRGEPFPLRLGVNSSGSSDCDLKDDVDDWVSPLSTGVTERCEISRQRALHDGDPANVMLSEVHGEPATPIFETFDGDPVQFRLIQGAQEVQHTFTLEGYNWTRHIDQAFASVTRDLDTVQPDTTLVRDCALSAGAESSVRMAHAGRPDQYRLWALYGSSHFSDPDDRRFWRDMDRQMANCFNTEGRLAAQEVGISEHFEFKAGLLHDSNIVSLKDKVTLRRLNLNQLTRQELLDYLVEQREILVLKISVSDTPYHFGTQDALWNGAWGLVRVEPTNRNFFAYQRLIAVFDEAIADLNGDVALEDVLRDIRPYLNAPLDTVIGRFPELSTNDRLLLSPRALDRGQVNEAPVERLVPLERFEQEALRSTTRLPEADRDKVLRRIEVPQALRGQNLRPTLEEYGRFFRDKTSVPEYKQVADCPARAPNVYTAIVAIESETVFGSGTRYSDELYDQNGLFFALVDPRALIRKEGEDLDAVSDVDIEDRSRWLNVPLPRVVAEIQRVYSKPEPLVVNVKAGDCVHVTLLNALKTASGSNPGLVDDTGDAMMPGITSLNVERPWETGSDEENQPHVHTATSDREKDVVPSSRLAVTFPLPVLTSQSVYARPYGQNQVWALNGITNSDAAILSIRDLSDRLNKPRIAEIEQFRFYAGLVFADYRWIRGAPLVANAEPGLTRDFFANLGVDGGIEVPRELSAIPLAGAQQQTLGDTIGRFLEVQSDIRIRANDVLRPVIDLPIPRPDIEPQLPDFDGRAVLEPIERNTLLETRDRAFGAEVGVLPNISGMTMTLPNGNRGDIASVENVITAGEAAGILTTGEASELNREITDLTRELDQARERLIDDLVDVSVLKRELVPNFIPYAFGALPLKSFGDVIGHPTHGLVGAFTVVPQNATIGDTRGPRVPFETCRNPQILPGGLSFERAVPRLRLYDLGPIQADRWTGIGDLIATRCNNFVIVPNKSEKPFWNATLNTSGPDNSCDTPGTAGQPCQEHRIRQFTLFWQDGLPLRDKSTADTFDLAGSNENLVKDCAICDDSYDFGDKGVSYKSEPFHVRLRSTNPTPIESHFNLNAFEFGENFFLLEPGEVPAMVNAPMPVLRAEAGEEIVVHVVHPGGRARQRAFATIAQDYDDLFPNFGFARAALLAPGKAITASIMKPVEPGCYLWFDGPLHLRAGGVWGLLDVVDAGDMNDRSATQCLPGR